MRGRCNVRASLCWRPRESTITRSRDVWRSAAIRPLSGANASRRTASPRPPAICRAADATHASTRPDRAGDDPDAARGCHPSEHAHLGRRAGCARYHRAQGLARQRAQAAPDRDFQGLARSRFVEKLEDVVGLYLMPPERVLVLGCDEKGQVQALDRTQPGPPMKNEAPH